jgi:sterol desaturase/sphingolipid hydroxylase (fatty acid hydroxylase superfamily)
MGIEHEVLRRRAARQGPSAGDYERRDTLTSLAMGVGSLTIPMVMGRLLRLVTPGRGRYARVLVGVGVAAAALTTAADVVVRRSERDAATTAPAVRPADGSSADGEGEGEARAEGETSLVRWARRIRPSTGATAVAAGIVAASTGWAARTSGARLYGRFGRSRDRGTGVAAVLGAIVAWDAIYYWNHRLQHESRWLWAIHSVHHSSERYNLSTALRQPVAENLGAFVPYGLLGAAGLRPSVIEVARTLNLLYQYWIHTETISSLGPAEHVLNTPSHHRVHHGSNRRYLDRNHGSILIVWDRLFGTFEREDPAEPVVYGLTRNIQTFNPVRVATVEHTAMVRGVAESTTWHERLGRVLGPPGWSPKGMVDPVPVGAQG